MIQITDGPQRVVVYKINPNEQELNGEVNFDRNVDGRIFHGEVFIADHALVIKDKEKVEAVFSLHKYYFLA